MSIFTPTEKLLGALFALIFVVSVILMVADQIDYARFSEGCQLRGGITIRASSGHRACVSEVAK